MYILYGSKDGNYLKFKRLLAELEGACQAPSRWVRVRVYSSSIVVRGEGGDQATLMACGAKARESRRLRWDGVVRSLRGGDAPIKPRSLRSPCG